MLLFCFFFFNDTATTEIYTLSLHDALPISSVTAQVMAGVALARAGVPLDGALIVTTVADEETGGRQGRSEEHTSELQSRQYLVCRLLLEKKKKKLSMSTMT